MTGLYDIFLCYRKEDKLIAKIIAGFLSGLGLKVFMDEEMEGGVDWENKITSAIASSKTMIVLRGSKRGLSNFQKREVTIGSIPRSQGQKLFPVVLGRKHSKLVMEEELSETQAFFLGERGQAQELLRIILIGNSPSKDPITTPPDVSPPPIEDAEAIPSATLRRLKLLWLLASQVARSLLFAGRKLIWEVFYMRKIRINETQRFATGLALLLICISALALLDRFVKDIVAPSAMYIFLYGAILYALWMQLRWTVRPKISKFNLQFLNVTPTWFSLYLGLFVPLIGLFVGGDGGAFERWSMATGIHSVALLFPAMLGVFVSKPKVAWKIGVAMAYYLTGVIIFTVLAGELLFYGGIKEVLRELMRHSLET